MEAGGGRSQVGDLTTSGHVGVVTKAGIRLRMSIRMTSFKVAALKTSRSSRPRTTGQALYLDPNLLKSGEKI